MNDSDIIDALGGTAAVARLCKVRQPSVSEWRTKGIPDARRQFLELLRPDVFRGGPPPARRTEAAEEGEGGAASTAGIPIQPLKAAA